MAGLFSRAIHFAVDATLLAGLLSGLKKTSGYTPNFSLVNQPEVEKYLQKYLDYGDYVYSEASGIISTSSFFKKG